MLGLFPRVLGAHSLDISDVSATQSMAHQPAAASGSLLNMQILGLHPTVTKSAALGIGPALCSLISCPGDPNKHSSLGTTGTHDDFRNCENSPMAPFTPHHVDLPPPVAHLNLHRLTSSLSLKLWILQDANANEHFKLSSVIYIFSEVSYFSGFTREMDSRC